MDPSVEFLLDNVKQLVLYHVNLMADAKNQLQGLNTELDKLKAILQKASKNYKKDEIFKQWEREIREVVYDVEDTIDTCITHMAAEKAKKTSHFRRLFTSTPTSLAEAVKKIRKDKVTPLLNNVDFGKFTIANAVDTVVKEAREIRQKKTQNIVGFEEETAHFISFLTRESDKLDTAAIVGMAGLGKTTLAWKIFEDQTIKYEFPVRIWVNISDDLNMKNVLLTILRKFTANPPDGSVEELIIDVRDHLKEGKFFIVMDDVWTLSAWDKIKDILPRSNKMGRVLVTTRHKDVAERASSDTAHYLRFLTSTESWELLQYEVYSELNVVPPELVGVGRVIATDCDGLPLSIVVIGGILVEKKSRCGSFISSLKKEWDEVSRSVKRYLVDGDKKKLLSSIISLSYEKLPYELRNCFLYLGVFPEDADIPVKGLIRLWIAEGFIQESGGKSLEVIALDNLKEFINRNLVMVKEAKLDGEPKICHIHDSVREICKSEAAYDSLNLFQEITMSGQGDFEPRTEIIEKSRRLCIHSYVLDFLKKKHKVPKARSFLCFHQSPMSLKPTDMAFVTDGFGLLRVYDAKNIKFPKFPQKFVTLLHLRYLTLIVDQCNTLPEVISDLWNLQTLIVDVSSSTLDIKADIWKMRQLRHLKTKASITLKKDGRGDGCEKLQTLSRLSPESCTAQVFSKARNLITLGIQGDLNQLAGSDCLGNLDRLHKLKLVHEVPNEVASEKPLRKLPESQSFPPHVKILVLIGTYLDWTKMTILSQLGSLEELKLKENAFRGNSWEAVNGGFHRLELLHMERATELVYWTAMGDPFPNLRFLLLSNCEKLLEVPSVLGKKLEMLSLERVTDDAVSSAEKIGREQKMNGRMIKLDIAPADKVRKSN